jgi:hypothetical protein
LFVPSTIFHISDLEARLSSLNTAAAQEAAAKLEPLDPLLLADATPEQRRNLSSIQVPAVFQQYMRQLQLSLSDRLDLLARLRDSGAQSTAVWMLENAPRFQAAYEARLAESQTKEQSESSKEVLQSSLCNTINQFVSFITC